VTAHRSDDSAVIAIADHGIGIAPDKLDRIFDRFFQVDGTSTRRFGGIGIGLALCQAIVQAHGGHIQAESAGVGHGATFRVTLPLPHTIEIAD
ncbi:MAG TPA: ATP-binding protein, partial [Anaerolineae bacterium]|nr:ATP-binding protein [Anaerolineae bacterium]